MEEFKVRVDILQKSINIRSPFVYRLRTNATNFKIFYELEYVRKGTFPHVGVTAREGLLVMFKRPEDKSWMVINAYSRKSPVTISMKPLVENDEEYDLLIYGPMMATFSELYLDIPEGCPIVSIEENEIDRILIAGGINSFGIGCTTTSMLFSSIIGRKTNSIINNFSLNKNSFLKEYHASFIEGNRKVPMHDICILEIDSYAQSEEDLEKYLPDVVDLFKSRCKKLICWFALPPESESKKSLITELLKDYENEIIIEDISCIFSNKYADMCVYSNRFINDTANVMIYKKLSKWLAE